MTSDRRDTDEALNAATWWVVRAGEGACAYKRFKDGGFVAAGSSTPSSRDIPKAKTREELEQICLRHDRDFPPWRMDEVERFVLHMQPGHVVASPSKGSAKCIIQIVRSEPRFVHQDAHGLHIQRDASLVAEVRVPPEFCDLLHKGERKGTIFDVSDADRHRFLYLLRGSIATGQRC